MVTPARHETERGASPGVFSLVEEAVVLLRRQPLALARYYIGALPFVLGFLFFWADMSRNAFAAERCAVSALVLAALYWWMKTWQSLFTRSLLAAVRSVRRESPEGDVGGTVEETAESAGPGLRAFLRAGATQSLQATGLFVLPLALLMAVPFGWCYTFYQALTVEGDGRPTPERGEAPGPMRRAWRQAAVRPMEQHLLLGLLGTVAGVAFLNVAIMLFNLPLLLRNLAGIETQFSRSGLHMLNGTFFAVVLALTYLGVDPLVKAVYCLRSFYVVSLSTGEDLVVELRRLSRGRALQGLGVMTALVLLVLGGAGARCAAAPEDPAVASPEQFERTAEAVLQQPEYAWRMPAPRKPATKDEGILHGFFSSVVDLLESVVKSIGRWLGDVIDWLQKLFPTRYPPAGREKAQADWQFWTHVLLSVCLALVVAVLAVSLMRLWKRRHRGAREEEPLVVERSPDLEDEGVAATDLPVDQWTALAEQYRRRGEHRLALRAYYLADLAFLDQIALLNVAPHKTNRDYRGEVGRRGHALGDLFRCFSDNVRIVDRVWYGSAEADASLVEQFTFNCGVIRDCAQGQ